MKKNSQGANAVGFALVMLGMVLLSFWFLSIH